jgi:hypothetical protein
MDKALYQAKLRQLEKSLKSGRITMTRFQEKKRKLRNQHLGLTRRGPKPTAGTKRLKEWQKKGYYLEGTVSLTKKEAQDRAKFLRSKGYKARAVKGNYSLYIVAREPYDKRKKRK